MTHSNKTPYKGRRVRASAVVYAPPKILDPITKAPVKLPIRVPTFKIRGGAVEWAYNTWPPHERQRNSFKVLYCVAGYLDAGIDTPSIREISSLCQLEPKRVLQILVKLEKELWIICDWAQHPNECNWYFCNYSRRRVPSHDPYRHTYQPKAKPKGGRSARKAVESNNEAHARSG